MSEIGLRPQVAALENRVRTLEEVVERLLMASGCLARRIDKLANLVTPLVPASDGFALGMYQKHDEALKQGFNEHRRWLEEQNRNSMAHLTDSGRKSG